MKVLKSTKTILKIQDSFKTYFINKNTLKNALRRIITAHIFCKQDKRFEFDIDRKEDLEKILDYFKLLDVEFLINFQI